MSDILWDSAAAAKATGGESATEWEATSVSIDTRTLEPGALFVALKDVRDGHDFVADALTKGAAAALVDRVPDGVAEDAPLLIVADVLEGLEALGKAARKRTQAKVIGITGSVGKTSTKEMLRTMLMGQGKVHAAERSYNNHWGVPLTLARMPEDTDYAVIEIGMNAPGEIAPLAKLAKLDLALVTTVAPAHLEAFESVAAIAKEKASILDGLKSGGVAVLNADIDSAALLMERAAVAGARCIGFGKSDGVPARLTDVRVVDGATELAARITGEGDAQDFAVTLQTPGLHFAMNAVAALAAVVALGADAIQAAVALGNWTPYAGRGVRAQISLSAEDTALSFDLIDDAYNANPASVAAGLEMLAALSPKDGVGHVARGRRQVILGDMLELGDTGPDLHAALAQHPAMRAIDTVHCVGPLSQSLWAALPEGKRGLSAESSNDLVPRVGELVDAGDIILVKGSLGSRLAPVVAALRALGPSGTD